MDGIRHVRRSLCAALLAMCVCAPAFAQAPMRIIIGFPGGPLEQLARLIGQGMSEELRQTIIVEGKPGASGLIASEFLRNAAPDGLTVLIVPSTFVVNPMTMEQAKYDPVKDFAHIGLISTISSAMIVGPDSKFTSVKDVIAAAKVPGSNITYATTGVGSAGHLWSELLMSRTGAKMTHVPFKSLPAALTEVLAGRVSFTWQTSSGLKGLMDAGRLKALAVAGTRTRLPDAPNVPTMAEAGFAGFDDVGIWFGMIAPPKLPATLITKYNVALQNTLRKPQTVERLKTLGSVPTTGSPADFTTFLMKDGERWRTLIRTAKISVPGG